MSRDPSPPAGTAEDRAAARRWKERNGLYKATEKEVDDLAWLLATLRRAAYRRGVEAMRALVIRQFGGPTYDQHLVMKVIRDLKVPDDAD